MVQSARSHQLYQQGQKERSVIIVRLFVWLIIPPFHLRGQGHDLHEVVRYQYFGSIKTFRRSFQ